MIVIDLLIVAILVYSAYIGTKHGMVLLGLELASFVLATLTALFLYHPFGAAVRAMAQLPTPLSNVIGFAVIWLVAEILLALASKKWVLPRLTHNIQVSSLNQAGGAVLSVVKYAAIITLSLIVFAELPLSASTKAVVTGATIPKFMLASSGALQSWLAGGLGQDLGSSLNFFTVTASPESTERIDLGYTTTGVVDPSDEDTMLVMLNHERTTRGLTALTLNPKARAVARAYSADMFRRGFFSHISPEGKTPFDRMRAAGVQFGAAGENLALAPTLQLAEQGLMNSPGHRANILSTIYRTVGIGIIDGGPYGLMITQDFTD